MSKSAASPLSQLGLRASPRATPVSSLGLDWDLPIQLHHSCRTDLVERAIEAKKLLWLRSAQRPGTSGIRGLAELRSPHPGDHVERS